MFKFSNFACKRSLFAFILFFIHSSLCLADTPGEVKSSSVASEEVPWKEIQDRTEKIFKELNQGEEIVWSLTLTPLLPDRWPLRSSTVWMRYAYARGQDFPPGHLIDGERISSPFLRIELHRGTPLANLVALSTQLNAIGIQGIRPLHAEEKEIFKSQSEIEEMMLRRDADDLDVSGVRNFYRLWIQTNGVIVQELRSSHDDFFRWIEAE